MWTSIAALICLLSLGFVNCSSEPESMVMSIGHLDYGVYPYALHDKDVANCINKDTFDKQMLNSNNVTADFWNTLRCFIDFSYEMKEGMNSITKTTQKRKPEASAEELLGKYCARWVPKIDPCFQTTTSLLNDCEERETDRGYRSLFFAAAYMSYICQNQTKSLENLFKESSADKVSLGCFLELESDIVNCARTKVAKNNATDFCTNLNVTKSCYLENYKTVAQSICNSTNYNESQVFVSSLFEHMQSELCHETETMDEKITFAKQTARTGKELGVGEQKNNAHSMSFAREVLISTFVIISYVNLNIITS